MNSVTIRLSDLYSSYKDWIRRNPQTAGEVEKTVKWLSYFVAGKINKSVVLTELIYSASSLLVVFNDIIIYSGKQKVNVCDKIKVWLTVLEYSEVFIEVSSKSVWGNKGKWVVISCVQLLKSAARLVLLLHYKERIVSCPPFLPCKRNEAKNGGGTEAIPRINNVAFSLKTSGRVIRKVDSAPPLSSRLWKPPSLPFCNNNVEEQPDKALLQKYLIGEVIIRKRFGQASQTQVLYIVKPIVNLLFMKKYGRQTWKPWVVSAAMDLISLHLLLSKSKNQTTTNFSQSQRMELSRRRLVLILYLMRSPFYEKYSKNRIDAFLNSLSRNLPLARLICTPIQQHLPHWQDTYFYLWSS